MLFNGNGTQTVPLSDTPGYQLKSIGINAYTIQTSDGVENAFGTWAYVNGTTRIMGGGVFDLTFGPTVNLLTDVNFADTTIDSIFGLGNQYIAGELVVTTPEPQVAPLLVFCLSAILLVGRKANRR